MNFSSKIRKRLHTVQGNPVISSFDASTEKRLFKVRTKSAKPFIKYIGYFLNNFKYLGKIPENATLVIS